MIELKTITDDLFVLNPKQIYHVCASQSETLPEAQIRQICHQLDQKCRLAVD
jgi:hypothetical protein